MIFGPSTAARANPAALWFAQRRDVHRLAHRDPATAEQLDGRFVARRRGILDEQVGKRLEEREVTLVVRAGSEVGHGGLSVPRGISPVAQRGQGELVLQRIDFCQIGGVSRDHADSNGVHDAVGRHAMFDHSRWQGALPVRADERMATALALGGAGADVEEIVGVRIGHLDRPIPIRNVGGRQDHRLVLELQQRAAVHSVVVGCVGHDVIGRREILHVADLVERGRRRIALGLLQRGRVESQTAFPLVDGQR